MSIAAKIYDMTLAIGQSKELLVQGTYYRIQTATGTVTVSRNGGSAVGPLLPGQGEQGDDFSRLTVTNTTGSINNLTVLIADNNFIDNRLQGSVTVTNTNGGFTQNNLTVGTASTILANSNSNRRYLLIQNLGATDLFLMLYGGSATLAGIKIAAGASYELNGYTPTGYITGITASGTVSVVVVEG
jgi:hypothetical protein